MHFVDARGDKQKFPIWKSLSIDINNGIPSARFLASKNDWKGWKVEKKAKIVQNQIF